MTSRADLLKERAVARDVVVREPLIADWPKNIDAALAQFVGAGAVIIDARNFLLRKKTGFCVKMQEGGWLHAVSCCCRTHAGSVQHTWGVFRNVHMCKSPCCALTLDHVLYPHLLRTVPCLFLHVSNALRALVTAAVH